MRNSAAYLWLDTETTGLDFEKNDIIQIACVPVIDGKQHAAFNQYCQPINWLNIDKEALDVNKIKLEDLANFQKPEVMLDNLISYIKSFNVKFTIAGFNVGFDKDFIASMFKKLNREDEFFELFNQETRDTYKRAKKLKNQLPVNNLKLGTLCSHFNIEINAHDALSDILATIKLDGILSEMLGEVDVHEADSYTLLDVSFPEPVQLHVHSMYSYTDSINSVKEWADWCEQNNVPGFSTVDHGIAAGLFDITRLNKEKVIGVPGVGLIVRHDGMRFHLNAWATSLEGYRNLMKLASIGWHNKYVDSGVELPQLALRDIVARKQGLVFGVPGIKGPAIGYILSRQHDEAVKIIQHLNSSLDIRLELAAINVHKYYDPEIGFVGYAVQGGNIQKHINKFYLDLSKKLGIKCVPVSDAHLIDPEDKIVQDCISKNAYRDSRYFYETRSVVKSREMYSILKSHLGDDLTEQDFMRMIENTYEIANLASKIEVKYDYHLPKIDIPQHIKDKTDDYKMQTYYYMMQKIKEHGRWNPDPVYVERFKKEIDVIMNNSTLNFIPYFLVYEDVCAYARSSGLLQGISRGSAGGSLISYYLKIIHIDPIAAKLPFERFLSHARIRAGSFPDIDLDISDRARPLVMKYLQEKYGLGFAQIATFSKMKTKNAIKDAMYALYGRNRNDPEVKAVCDSIDDSPQGIDEHDFLYGYVDNEGVEHEGEIKKKPILQNFFNQRPQVEKIVRKLIGSIRGLSRHASAFVISTLDLSSDRVPTIVMTDRDVGDVLVTQFDASMIEKSGLVKADILGVKTLTMLSDAVELIKKNHGVDYLEEDKGVPLIYRLPDRDPGVFQDFYNKDTDSSFQFNTDLIKSFAREFAPSSKAELAAMTALCRPGALDAPLYDTYAAQYYIDVKNGKREVQYLHPDLEPILKDSNGVFVYQEEVMQFLVDIVGYTWEEADLIRSAIAKKKHDVIMSTFSRIRESCSKRGWPKDTIETICQQIIAFSKYSFNKSHSYAYGELGYITLYIKHHYPLEWWCSVLNNEDKEDKIRKYIAYLGDKVKQPSLKNPKNIYTIDNNKIVAPIRSIKSIGPAVVEEIVSKGPFESLEDFVARVNHSKVNIGSMSALIKARAADDLMDKWSDDPSEVDESRGVKTYVQARLDFMRKYVALRNIKTNFKEDMWDLDPIKVFLQEREYNLSFNKTLLSSKEILSILKSKWSRLEETGSKSIPLCIRTSTTKSNYLYVVASIKHAENLLKSKEANKLKDIKEIGMILLFESSSYTSGVSKKGRPWHKVSIVMSDGYSTIECVQWDAKKALGWPKNTIAFVKGELKPGWRTPVSIMVSDIQKL